MNVRTDHDGLIVCDLIKAMRGMRECGWVMSDLVRAVNWSVRDVLRLSNDAAALVAFGICL